MHLTALIIAHPLLGDAPLRLLLDLRPRTLPDHNGVPQLFEARSLSAAAGSADDSGQDQRDFGIADVDFRLWNALVDNIGGDTPVTVIQLEWDTDDLSAPISAVMFELDDAEIATSTALTFSAASPDVDYAAPRETWNRRNTPQLRR